MKVQGMAAWHQEARDRVERKQWRENGGTYFVDEELELDDGGSALVLTVTFDARTTESGRGTVKERTTEMFLKCEGQVRTTEHFSEPPRVLSRAKTKLVKLLMHLTTNHW